MLIGTLTKGRAGGFTKTLSDVHYQVRWSRPTARGAPEAVPRAIQPKASYSVVTTVMIDLFKAVQ